MKHVEIQHHFVREKKYLVEKWKSNIAIHKTNMRMSLQKVYLDLDTTYVNLSLELQTPRRVVSSQIINYKGSVET